MTTVNPATIEFVSFGRNDAWFVKFSNGEQTYHNLPAKLGHLINKKNQNGVKVKAVSLSPDDGRWYVRFMDQTAAAIGFTEEVTNAMKEGIVKYVTFFPNNGYLVACETMNYSRNLPGTVAQKLKKQQTPTVLASGGWGGWFADYTDCFKMGDYIPTKLYEHVNGVKFGDITFLSISSDNEHFFARTSKGAVWYLVPGCSKLSSWIHLTPVRMDPSHIRFTQTSIASHFSRGDRVSDVVNWLWYGEMSPEDMDTIDVVRHGCYFYTLGNRRLYAFQQAQIPNIPVRVVTPEEIRIEGPGTSIVVRGG